MVYLPSPWACHITVDNAYLLDKLGLSPRASKIDPFVFVQRTDKQLVRPPPSSALFALIDKIKSLASHALHEDLDSTVLLILSSVTTGLY